MADESSVDYMEHMRASLDGPFPSLDELGRLISRLEVLAGHLHHPDDDWQRRFWEAWSTLEQVYAVALDRNAETLDGDSEALVSEALGVLRSLVMAK